MMLIAIGAATELRPVNINGLALNTTLYYAADLSYLALDIGLSSTLFGAPPPTPRLGETAKLISLSMAGILTFLVIVALVFLT